MSRQSHNHDNQLPSELKYRIIDNGQQQEISAAELERNGGLSKYASEHPQSTIEMHDENGSEYSVPINRAQEMSDKGWIFSMSIEKPTPQQVAIAKVTPAIGKAQLDRSRDALMENFESGQQYRTLGGVDGKSVAGSYRFNPETRQVQQSLIRPDGQTVLSYPTADDYKDYSVGAQLREATKRLRELEEKKAGRAVEVDKEWSDNNKDNTAPLSMLLARDTYVPMQMTDRENRALALAINQTQDLIQKLKDQQDRERGIDVGFWRGFGQTVGDARTWDFGLGDMLDALTMLDADRLKGENATEGEREAYNDMMRAIYDLQVAGQRYDQNADFWNRAGVMAGYMPSFMVDFVLTGGGFKGINAASKAASKAATKALGKEAIKSMSEMGVKNYVKQAGAKGIGQAAANYMIKTLGVTADDMLIRAPLMANTIQAGKTGSAIIESKLGDVKVDKDGNYQFSNDKNWGEAAWQTEADQIIENYSEMVGTYLDPVLSGANIGKLANVLGAKRLSGMLAKADAGALGRISRQTQKMFGEMGLSNYVGEVGEEYYGQLWRTLLGLDSAYQQNPDGTRTNLFATGQFHGDIWGGMALSMGMMDATRHGINASRYAYEKHKVNTADKKAGEIVGNEVWESLKQQIDNTANEEMGELFVTMLYDEQLNQEQKEAILDYMEKSMNFRGYNLASMADSRNTEKDPIRQEANESFIHGNDATDATDMQDIKNIYDLQLQQASQQLSPEVIAEIDSDPINTISSLRERGELSQPAIDYINARQAYNGMMQRIEDDINEAIEQNNAIVDKRTNRDTGLLQEATLKVQNDDGTDRRVHIIKGNIALRDDGTIDKDRSDRNIAILDVRTGKEEIVSPDAIFSVESPVDPAAEKAIAADAVRQSYTAQAEAKMNGIVYFQPGDTYNILTPEGQPAQIQIVPNAEGMTDNGDGTVNVTSDGGQNVVQMSKDAIQEMVNAANIARVAGRVQPQQQQEQAIQQEEQQQGSVPDYYPGSSITFRDNDGNIVQGVVNAIVPDDNYVLVDIDTPNGLRVVPYKIDHINDNLESIADEDGNIIYSRQHRDDVPTQNITLTEQQMDILLTQMKEQAEIAQNVELNPITWNRYFGENGIINTPLGEVKMGENQIAKFFSKGRDKEFGMVAPTLSNPDIVIEKDAPAENAERNTKLLFVKTFIKSDGSRYVHFESVTVKKDGMEVSISSHEANEKTIKKEMQNGNILHLRIGLPFSSEGYLTETPLQEGPDLVPTSDNTSSSDNKDNTNLPQIQEKSALSRIPIDKNGQPIYEQTDPETAWDAIVEQTGGNEDIAVSVVNSMISDKESQLKKVEKSKPKGGTTIAEKIAAEQERNNAIQQAQAELKHWRDIANVPADRQRAAQAEARRLQDEQARENAARIEQERRAKEEAERIERETLNGVPDMIDDTPADARARGYRRVSGNRVDRQPQNIPSLQGKEVKIKFNDSNIPTGHVAIIDASLLQPSHINGQRNPKHFIDEAQPKERKGDDSTIAASRIASNIRPEEITSSVTAYTGAPTVNTRGEVIQGNNRSTALREMWSNYPEQAAIYRQYLIDNAEEFGMNPQDIAAIQNPVLVNMLDIDDAKAIELGQYVASDTESGGIERIRPKNVIQRMGKDIQKFTSNLLNSTDEEATFAQLIDRNGGDVLKWMNNKGYITPTQYRSAFDSKGTLTDEVKNDLRGIIYQSIFEGTSPQFEEMFNMLPAKAQKAILSTAYRDYDSDNTKRLLNEIQNSVRAYYALSQYEPFVNARNYAETQASIQAWSNQYLLDDVTGDSYLPAERFNNFNLLLAAMYKGQTQKLMQSTFNNIYDIVQGVKEDNLFETVDNTPRSLADAINETINNFNLAENFEYNGQLGSNVLGGNTQTSQAGRQGGNGTPAPREQTENTERAAYDNRGTESSSGENKVTPKLFQYFTGTLSELVSQAKQSTQGLIKKVIAPISSRLKNDLNSQGLQIDNDYNHVIDNNAIRHILKKHSGKNEEKKGQIPIIDTDFQIIADVVANYDGVEVVSGNTPVQRIIYNKAYSDGTVVYVEEQRVGRKELAAVTMWKKKSPNLTDANRTETTLIPDLTEVSENKDTTNSSNVNEIGEKVANAEAETDTSPTEAQKEAGNYRKGHVKIGTFDVTIENPKGSIRSGTDARGNRWENTMNNTYGYIRGTEGVDGDHIDVFLSNDIDNWDNRQIFVIDQYNEDGTFDEHKVMLGFNDETDAFNAYLSNYNKGWEDTRKLTVTSSTLDDFKKWIDSSHRKTKPFAEYKTVKKATATPGNESKPDGYTVERRFHKKNGTYIHAVKFTEQMPRERFLELKKRVKDFGGYYSSFGKGGFIFDNEADADKFAQAVLDPTGEQLDDAVPVSIADLRELTAFEKENSVRDNTTDTGTTVTGKQNGTAPLQNTFSENKDSDIPSNKQNPSGNKLVTDERYEELKRRMKAKLGQLNVGIDPEILAIGTEMAVYHIEKGARKFAEFAKAMIADLGDAIRPYLKAFYNGARDLPEVDESGLAADMTSYDEVRTFDVANFDKENIDPFATAETVVAEQTIQEQTDGAKQEIINQRNNERRKENEQTTADTEAIASQAEVTANKAESDIEAATTEQQVNDGIALIDDQLEKVNQQLALLGYYEAEPVESDFNEAYGYMRNAEKKAVKDANSLAKRLIKDLGIDPDTIVDKKGKKRRSYAVANIAPAGGDISVRLPLTNDRELYIDIDLDTDYKEGIRDNLILAHVYFRIENPTASGQAQYVSNNAWINSDTPYSELLRQVRNLVKLYAPEFNLAETSTKSEENKTDKTKKARKNAVSSHIQGNLFGELFEEESEPVNESQKFSKGEKVLYKGQPATVFDIEDDGRPVLDTGLAPVIYEVAEISEVKRINDNRNGLQGNDDAIRSERLPADSGGHGERLSRSIETNSEKQEEGSQRPDGRRQAGSDGVNRTVRPRLSDTVTASKNARNNHSERGADHAPTSVDARIGANIKAIELVQQLIENGDTATPEQMSVLRKFSGWGGLGKAFSDNQTSSRLQELLGTEGLEQAIMSANSAYYTPAYVIDILWDIAEQMGFKGGNILEGSAGIGNILGQMPTSISERSDIHAIEIDQTSGSILSLLYPDAKVDIQGFEQTRIPNGSVDLAITNVPFVTGLRVDDTTGDKDLSKKFHNIHDFCIAKNVRKLREGGIGIFISSNGTLDNSKKLRDWIVSEGGSDFVGAFRMNNKTFGGTAVTSDIIVIRKRVNGKKSPNAIDVSTISGERTAEFDTGETRKVKGQEIPIIKQLSMDYNRYFIEHPENMAGTMRFAFEEGDTFRPTSKGLYPAGGKSQEQMLSDFVNSFSGKDWTDDGIRSGNETTSDNGYVADSTADGKKVGELYEKDGKLVIASVGGYYPLEVNANKVKGHTKLECFKAYEAIKNALADVLDYQTNNESDKGLKPLLDKLNKAYDDFVSTYGHFNKNTSISFLRNDVDFPNVFSLEKYEETVDKKGNNIQKFGKTDVFSKRVVEKEKEPTPTNVKDGIIASVFKFGRIDVPYIAGQLGENVEDVRKDIINNGYGFEDPATRQIEVSFQYLSGNVREKLRIAQENNENGIYDGNIKALQEVIPMDIPAHLIDFTLGSSWIDPKLYEDYVRERTDIDVRFTAAGGTWFMKAPEYGLNKEKNRAMGVVSEMLRKTIFGHTLIEAAIQNRSITVSQTNRKWDGTTETITDKEATQACAAKIDEIRQDFKDWARQKMQSDSEMSATIERIYNDTFNNFVPMSIPDDFVPEYFGGASHKFKMRSHQGKAIVRGTMQPLLLAHEVGTGKTFTLISTAMEMRRLGTARKPMIVVQNATVGQFVASAKELYPNAKILTLEESDRSAEGRKNFYAKIRYNDWDMIVVPQSTFEFIPDSEERQMAFVQDKIQEKMIVLEQMKEADPNGKSMITRQAEREIEQLEEQLAGLTDEASKKRTANDQKKKAVALQNAEVRAKEMLDRRTDDVENFDDMGIDALLIDEAHEYKHLGFATAMQRGVKGVDPSYSKKSQGVYLKTQAVLEKNNGRNVIFATGTPISNTAAEIWTFMRYLMPSDTMKEYGIYYFDDFVRNFGNIQQMLEFTTSGKFKENNRFAGYVNLPELVRIWSGVTDTVLTREAGEVKDKIPEIENGKAQDIYLPQTRALRGIMKFVKAQLEEYENMSGKEKKENSHIPLTMYGIAKAAAVDARLVQEDAEDDPNSKTNEAVRQTLQSLKKTASYKGTVAIFADNYQNNQSGFNTYEDIKNKLIAEGVPAEQIVVMKSGMTVKKKLEIFDKVNKGEVRVILGSTFTLGTGVNIQERLHTLIHLDAPNRPMDYTQRNGRILRQGNLHKEWNKPVRILRFGVEDSLDVTAYQRLKTKGAIADSIMNGKQMMSNSMTNRVLEEEDDVFGDTVAQLSGSEYAMLKNNAEKNVRKYESRKKQWEADQTYIHNAKPKFKALIAQAERTEKEQKGYLEAVRKAFPEGTFNEITAGKRTFASVEAMADFFKEYNKSIAEATKKLKEGGSNTRQTRNLTVSLGGFSFIVQTTLSSDTVSGRGQLFTEVHRKMTYSCPELGLSDIPVHQGLLRNAIEDIVSNVITGKDFSEKADAAERNAAHNRSELEQLEMREGKPFEFDKELEQAHKQFQEYSEAMRKEMEEKEAKYAKMDAGIEAADNISGIDEDDDILMRDDDTVYRIRESDPPVKTGIGYKVFVLKNGKLYPPMVANPGGAETPVGVWLDADAAPIAGQSKTGRNQVKAGGKGTQGGSGKLAYRPGWHLGEIPYALQFNRMDEYGNKELFPANFVWAEVEYANDVDYQEEAMSYGMNANGKFQHSLAGLPRVPQNGSYRYRTNPNPETDPWIITGAMRVNRLLTPTEVDEMVEKAGREPQRRQEGAVTDEEIKNLNAQYQLADEMAAADTRAGRREMSERLQEISKKLHLDNVEIVTTTNGLDGKKARAKGFYTKSTGKITIVLPNNRNIDDAMQTLLHEAVAHYGLRQMFGKHFDTFLDNVFNNADTDVRRRIVELSKKHGWNFRTATEEYLASLAEQTNFEEINPSWWQKIKELFLRMLHNIGLKDFSGTTLSDNELRYILWRSYENLRDGTGMFEEAADIAKQYELKVGNYVETDNELFRDDSNGEYEQALARDRYEQRVSRGMYQTQEALQDSMLSIREAMDAVLRAEGKKMHVEDIAGFENAYLGENRLSSVNKAEADAFAHTLFKPLLDEVARLSHNEEERMQLMNYMMAKHGLERNKFMAERDAKESFEQEKDKYPNITLDDLIYEYRNRDYAGLTALTESENTAVAETKAMAMVDEYEKNHDVTQLWQRIKAVNDAILSKLYETGMMSKATYDYIKGMYKYYIPLRGFDEKTSAEAYAYLTHKDSAFNAPIKKAIGRTSKADDPLAYMQSMAESAIMQGNRNKLVKQRFFNFVLNHPSDLASINDIWLQYDSVNDEWKPVFPDNINNNDTAEDVERKMQEFEEKMQALKDASPDMYKHGKETVNIPYKIVSNTDLHQHQIVVKRNGRDYIITINGNPRAAQAINGQTNPDNDLSGAIGTILKAAEKLNRQLSAFYTTRNPDFVVSNFIRDMLYANSMAWIRESPNYALRFHRNFLRANPAQMKVLFAKLRNNTLDMNDYLENMFYQFIMNGGETGYANIRDIENRKNDIRRELRRANGKLKIGKAVNLLGERLDEYNRAVENCARFAAFMTSREMGRTIDRSIYDAKEASVNFNKKGSGSKFYNSEGQTGIGNIASFISGLGRSSYVFWNAAIQGTTNFGRQAKRHPAKAFTGLAAAFILGALIAELGGDDDDDKNAYYNLPEYVRRSNIMFRAGDSWISIPLPVEYRAVYGLGELMTSTLKGKENLTGGEMANQIASQVSQILPLDLMNDGGLMGLVPSAVKPFAEVMANESWTGLPIYKDTPWNKDMPDWTKAYKSANKEMVGFAEMLNDISGGDEYTKGKIDINPAAIQHILEGYFGGVATTIDRLAQTAEIIAGQREYDPQSILLLNRVVKNGDERTEYRAINNEYFRLKDEHDRLRARVRNYEHDTKEGIFDYAEKLHFLYNSPEYARYEIFEKYRPDIDSLYDELKETVDENDRKEIETLLNEVKRLLVEEANTTRK